MACDGEIPTITVDPYLSLAKRYKMPYTYVFSKDFEGNDFLFRETPRDIFFRGKDPNFISLDSDRLRSEEYLVTDQLEFECIATPIALSHHLRKSYVRQKLCFADTHFVTIPDRFGEKSTLEKVFQGAVDLFREFGFNRDRKRPLPEGTQKVALKKKQRMLDKELELVLSGES